LLGGCPLLGKSSWVVHAPRTDLLCAGSMKHDLLDHGDIGWQARRGNLPALAGRSPCFPACGCSPYLAVRMKIEKSPPYETALHSNHKCAGRLPSAATTRAKRCRGSQKRDDKPSSLGSLDATLANQRLKGETSVELGKIIGPSHPHSVGRRRLSGFCHCSRPLTSRNGGLQPNDETLKRETGRTRSDEMRPLLHVLCAT